MTEPSDRAPWWLLALGIPIGFASSLCGIGGGLFAGSLLHFGLRFPLKRSAATALVLVFATTAASTVTEAFHAESALDLKLIGALLGGVLVGAQLGFVFSERVNERTLRAIFAVVLLYSAARILGSSAEPSVATALGSGSARYAVACLVGLGGGFASPVLGVGGGLVMVPGLFLGLGDVSFDTARACSLAAGALASLRSIYLKHRAGRVDFAFGLRLGAGALIGATGGVMALGANPDLIEAGRTMLGVILILVGARFLIDWLRRP